MSAKHQGNEASAIGGIGAIGMTLYWVFHPSSAVLLGLFAVLTFGIVATFTLLYWQERKTGQTLFPMPFFIGAGLGLLFLGLSLWFSLRPGTGPPRMQAEALIKELKGEITVDKNAPGQPIVKVDFRDSRWRSPLHDSDLAKLKPHLEGLKELRELDLCGADVTDRGLAELRGLTQITTLILGGSYHNRLTMEGVEALRKALPDTKVFVEGWHTVPMPVVLDPQTVLDPGRNREVPKQGEKAQPGK